MNHTRNSSRMISKSLHCRRTASSTPLRSRAADLEGSVIRFGFYFAIRTARVDEKSRGILSKMSITQHIYWLSIEKSIKSIDFRTYRMFFSPTNNVFRMYPIRISIRDDEKSSSNQLTSVSASLSENRQKTIFFQHPHPRHRPQNRIFRLLFKLQLFFWTRPNLQEWA